MTACFCLKASKKEKKENIMKSTGMTRKVDELGRIVLPSEIRQSLNIQTKDPLEIFSEDGCIILKKYVPGCTFCADVNNVIEFEGKRICASCLERLKSI